MSPIPRPHRQPRRPPHWPAGAGVLLACLSGSPAAGVEPPTVPRNLVLVTVSSLRGDRVDRPIATRSRTPRLAAIAREGLLLRRARTPVPAPVPALASLWTGLDPSRHGLHRAGEGKLPDPSLPVRLAAAGFACLGAAPAGEVASTPALLEGFQEMLVTPERDGPARAARALAAAAAIPREQPLFLWLHLDDPAAPYPAVLTDMLEFAADDWNSLWRFKLPVATVPGLPATLPPDVLNGPLRRLDFYLDAHDAGVRQADRAVGVLWDGLDAAGRAEGTLFIVVSLHGEALGEHGHWFSHGRTLHEEELVAPVVFHGPGVRVHEEDADESATLLMDLFPTILAVLGVEDAVRLEDGFNLARYLRFPVALPRRFLHAGQVQPPYGRAVLAEYRFKLIITPPRPPMVDGPSWWTEVGDVELYDLRLDPLEGSRSERSRGAVTHQLGLHLRHNYPPWPRTPPAEDTSRRR